MFKTILTNINYQKKLRENLQTFKIIQNFCLRNFSTANKELETNNEAKILDTLNNSSQTELMSLGISKGRSEQIMTWRAENGPYENIEQMLKINGFGEKVVGKITSTILNPINKKSELTPVQKTKTKIGMQYSIPSVSEQLRLEIKSCLSLYVGVSSIAWCRFEINSKKGCFLTEWKYENILDKKLHINDLVKRCSTLLNDIPDSDCYVLENPKIAQQGQPGNPVQVNINVQKSQLIAILSYGLSSRKYLQGNKCDNLKVKPNLFYLKNYLSSRLFDRLVGSESVSTSQTVLDLLSTDNFENISTDDDYDIDKINNISAKISVPLNSKYEFENFDGVQREFIGQSMLIGLTFIRLCLIKCPISIDKINPNSKTKNI